ncbi:MAG: carbohydrate kinase family protein [Candidatus Aminicenantes bacterium]
MTQSYKKEKRAGRRYGLIGTITLDRISQQQKPDWTGVGGVLYQGAVLCALGKEVYLYTNLGQELVPETQKIIKNWTSLRKEGIRYFPGSGNQVHLHYPGSGERVEILKSVVPPLDPSVVLEELPGLDILILVLNSGFDIELPHWRQIVQRAGCPLWLDIHSLPLSRELNSPRQYLPLSDWKEWVRGATYVQANQKEIASVMGSPQKKPSQNEIRHFSKRIFALGVKALFVTLGKQGVMVLTPGRRERISSAQVNKVVDTTGCGDVFCGAAAVSLVEGKDPFDAAASSLRLASQAVKARGIEETFRCVKKWATKGNFFL